MKRKYSVVIVKGEEEGVQFVWFAKVLFYVCGMADVMKRGKSRSYHKRRWKHLQICLRIISVAFF